MDVSSITLPLIENKCNKFNQIKKPSFKGCCAIQYVNKSNIKQYKYLNTLLNE